MSLTTALIQQLYTPGSLRNGDTGPCFSLTNRLEDALVTRVPAVRVDGREVAPRDVEVHLAGEDPRPADEISDVFPLAFPLSRSLEVVVRGAPLADGEHRIELTVECRPFGELRVDARDVVDSGSAARERIPRDDADDYGTATVQARRAFVEAHTGVRLQHAARNSFDPHQARGNCEHFVGVAQVPLGIAGPLRVNGEHARGDFVVPLATSEGTLVASYNRGMRVLNAAGGVTCTVTDDAMQRAPAFVFADARRGRDFVKWVDDNLDRIRAAAEATSGFLRLAYVDPYTASRFVYLRFGFHTSDAAGQNMASRGTHAACMWILRNAAGIERFYLEANMATDKKASQINTLRTRGHRVTAEATIPRDLLKRYMRVEPESLAYHWGVANVGAFLAGANNNGLHSANGITALFIATGQDVANVAESSAAVVYTELTPSRDLYLSITIPSLIVGTHGGGTGLPTQRECLEMLGCAGAGKVEKFAEIVAGVVLAGEISLASAISSSDWVSSHERYGRHP
jgi:hydroxymethylglutaryl-CoA reductase (NADPH)